MTGPVEALTGILSAEVAQIRQALPLVREEEQALVRGDMAAILDLAGRKETLAREIVRLEQVRRHVAEGLARSLGVRPDRLTLSALVRLCPDSPPALPALGDELRGLAHALQAGSRRNGHLAQRALRHLDGLLAGLVSALTPSGTYAPTGRADQGTATLQVLDRQA